ncbi:glutaredoxin family protein [Paenibacillus algorifonticola]|uniref:Glutaredoxin n=1 Tax=Paenibacillus algorifonticola TaxID=684063 RepID=A0A1I2IBM7_9BACL|nr:glutaredoxin family protein [Paenibacillus algorifonticola]SFF38246.1 Glutaredoxin [Paenibacillus algorifonticola]
MSAAKKVIVWSKTGCQYCGTVKQFLEQNNQPYENIDIEGKDYLRDILEAKYGIRHVPVVEIGSDGVYTAVTDWDLEKIKALISPAPVAG